MSELVDFSKRGAIGVLTINNPPVNALGAGVRRGLIAGLDRGRDDAEVEAMVVIGGGRTFIAGADIREFGKPPQPPMFPEVLDRIESSGKPIVAAIHGTALGGGLEVALACHYRVGVARARVGLPEVKLGILPGAGGTQRLPRVVGPAKALEMIVSGDPVGGEEALALGILDELVEGDLLDGAVAFAEKVVAEGRGLRRISEIDDKVAGTDPALFDGFRKRIEKRARGYFAPWRCIEAVEAACTLPFAEGLKRERELFEQCMASPQRAAQMHVFFAEREVAKIPDVPKGTPARKIERAAVIGAGTMGGGIAMAFANAGIAVKVVEVVPEALERGLGVVEKNYAASVAKGRLAQAEMERRMGLIEGVLDYEAIADADIVIEAAFEEMELKKDIFARLDRICRPDAILASNTSTLDIDVMAAATKRPGQVIGTHFFSPANVMRLLEIVRGKETAKETIATAMGLAKRLGKVGVLVGNCEAFVGNRMLHGYLREANFLLEEGALPQQVDRVIQEFGMPMGPFAMSDLAGLDVGWRIRKAKAPTRPKDERYSPVADKICEMGRFGQKTGAGFYRYEPGSRTPVPDPVVEGIILETSRELGIERREISDDEILTRCLYPLINEGARILEEGIALRPGDIDIVYLYGYGFPPYRGGPMFWADSIGLDKVHATVCEYRDVHGRFWEPAPLLARLAAEGKGFGDR